MKTKLCSLIFLLLSLCIFTGLKVTANDNFGKIKITKTIVKEDLIYGRNPIVNLKIDSKEYSKYKNIEIVFVIERSSKMDDGKIKIIKNSLNEIIPNLLDNFIKIGIVTFGTDILTEYTTNNVTNDKDTLVDLINNIPNNSNTIDYSELNTNISSALEKASSLFTDTKNTNKNIILISSNEPTHFNYENTTYGSFISKTSYCVKWDKLECTLKYTASEYTKKIANKIKENNIFIHSIGLAVNNSTNNFLMSISNNYYQSINRENNLINSLNNSLDNITVIAKDIVITDTISNYFNINKEEILNNYPNATINNNNDGTISLKFYLDKINILNNYEFNYKLYPKNNYYGYINTSTNTIIEGISLIKGLYKDNKIYEYFPHSLVEIPSITNNDSYNIILGETLTTDKISGILNNDYLTKINNQDIKIIDKIIIEETTNSCGILKINIDGSFSYNPNTDCLNKKVEFNYYIESSINDKQIRSNTSKININVSKEGVNIINPKLEVNATNNVEDVNELVNYKINYYSIIENYLGNTKIIITSKLPCKIDVDNSILDSAIYNEDNLTLTWIIDIDNINTYKEGNKKINITKNIKLKYIDITNYRNLTNNIEVNLETSEKNNIVKTTSNTGINIKGNVIVSYIDNEGNKLKEDTIITDLINNDYITKEEIIKDYILVDYTGEISGKISLEDKQVQYIYYHNNSNYKEDLTITGNKKIDNYNNRIDYNIKYNTVIDDYIGLLEVILIDYLPYKIDIDNSILNNFIYYEEDNILIYTFKDNINTYKNGSYIININENLTIKYLNINEDDRIITNKIESLTTTNINTTSQDIFTTNIEIKSDVIGEYIDTKGNKIANDNIKKNLVGNDYIIDKKDIKGYTLKEIKGNNIGKHTNEDVNVSFVYEKKDVIKPKTKVNKINYNNMLVAITTSLTSIIFKKKIINISK